MEPGRPRQIVITEAADLDICQGRGDPSVDPRARGCADPTGQRGPRGLHRAAHRLPGSTAGIKLVPVTPRIHRELGLAMRDPENTAPALRTFVHTAKEVASKARQK